MDRDKEKEKKKDDFMQGELVNSFLLPEDEDEDEDKKIKEYLDSFPPGYGFRPTDEELVTYYLKRKLLDLPLNPNKMKKLNIYMYSPMQIFDEYKDDQEKGILYFFTPRDRKYPNGNRPNRVTADGDGYWKASGRAEDVTGSEGITVGYKRSLVYYIGSSKRSIKTNWLMNEFTLDHSSTPSRDSHDMKLDKWVLCKIYKKNKNDEGTEDEVDYKAQIVEIHEPRRMKNVNCSVPDQIYHASSSQMPGYHSHTMCSESHSLMPLIYNNRQNGFPMPQYPSQLMQIPDYNMSAQLPPTTMSIGSSSGSSIYNNNGPNGFLMPQYPSQLMQIPDYNMSAQLPPTTMSIGSSSGMSIYNNNGPNGFLMAQKPPQRTQLTNCSVLTDQLPNIIPSHEMSGASSPQMPVYHHNGQNDFLILKDHLVPNNRGYKILPRILNHPYQNDEMDYMINMPSDGRDWCGFTVLNEEELKPLDYKDSDNMKPRYRDI